MTGRTTVNGLRQALNMRASASVGMRAAMAAQGQRTFIVRFPQASFAHLAAQITIPLLAPAARQQSSKGSEQGSGNGERDWRSKFFDVRPHAAMGAVMLIASADELKKEQAAGDQLIDMIAPLLQQLSLGSALGYATGYALRVVGQMAAFAVGSVFMLVQIAAYKGYINVNWKQISGDTKKGLLDQDGDGDFDADDMKILMRKFIEICTYQLPSGAGFTAGLALGLGFTGGSAGKAALAVGTATAIPRTVAMLGSMATAGPGAMISLQEYATSASDAVKKGAGSAFKDPEMIWKASLIGKDLNGLRAAEKELRAKLKAEKDSSGKATLVSRIALIESMKYDLKNKK